MNSINSLVHEYPAELPSNAAPHNSCTHDGNGHNSTNNTNRARDHTRLLHLSLDNLSHIHGKVQAIEQRNLHIESILKTLLRDQMSLYEKVAPLQSSLELQSSTVASVSGKITQIGERLVEKGQIGEILNRLQWICGVLERGSQNELCLTSVVEGLGASVAKVKKDVDLILLNQGMAGTTVEKVGNGIESLREVSIRAYMRIEKAFGDIRADMDALSEGNSEQTYDIRTSLDRHAADKASHRELTAQQLSEIKNALALLNGNLHTSNRNDSTLNPRISALEDKGTETEKTQHGILALLVGMKQTGSRLNQWEQWQTDWSEEMAAWNSRFEEKLDFIIFRQQHLEQVKSGNGGGHVTGEVEADDDLDDWFGDDSASTMKASEVNDGTGKRYLYSLYIAMLTKTLWRDISSIPRWMGRVMIVLCLAQVLFAVFTANHAPTISQALNPITKLITTTNWVSLA
jgi:hypothetical protein